MSETEVNIHALDAAYTPFPTFNDWLSRTSIDTVRWNRYRASLEDRARNLPPEVLTRARNVAKRAAAIDTGAIEGLYDVDRGFTFTVALEAASWQAALDEKGERVRSLFEAQLHAYDYVLDLATKAEPVSEAAIRVLHEEVTRAQPTYRVVTAIGFQEQVLPKGQYKALPNHVRTRRGGTHSYAPVDVTPTEMARLTAELRWDGFLSAHPVLQAAYAHYCLVAIHPFADGNGRVARALASAFTYRAISMPIVILSEQKNTYLAALEHADDGDYQAFVNFMLDRALDTILLVDESLRSARAPSVEDSLAAIQSLYLTRGGYTHEQVDEGGERLLQAFQQAVSQARLKVNIPEVRFTESSNLGVNLGIPPGYRTSLKGARTLSFLTSSKAPVNVKVQRNYILFLPKDAAGDDDVQIVHAVSGPSRADSFVARMDQLIPAVSGVVQILLSMFADRLVSEMLAELNSQAQKAIGRQR